MSENEIRRSLVNHAPLRRRPVAVLRRMLDWLPEDTELYGDDAPVAPLERRLAEILGKPASPFFPTGTWARRARFAGPPRAPGGARLARTPQNHSVSWGGTGDRAAP